MDAISLVKKYFYSGYPYKTIHRLLQTRHNVVMSFRKLRRVIRKENLLRRRPVNDALLRKALAAILTEMRSSGCLLGYRAMWHRLWQKYKICVPRDVVMALLEAVDPIEVEQRRYHRLKRRVYRSKGPNFCWHMDGYDKLKPFGFPIHGCIDGFSRKVLWLRVGTSNNDPHLIAHHYLKTVQEMSGCPKIIRCDRGTENSVVAYLQPFLRRNCSDIFSGEDSFRYGRSTSNQRIEAWWSIFRKWNSDWWIDFFKNLKDCGAFDEADERQIEIIRFSFMEVIQAELDCLVEEWNTHRIRKCNMGDVKSGIPDELYYLGDFIDGVVDHICDVNAQDISYSESFVKSPSAPASLSTLNAIADIMEARDLEMPTTVEQAIKLFILLTNELC